MPRRWPFEKCRATPAPWCMLVTLLALALPALLVAQETGRTGPGESRTVPGEIRGAGIALEAELRGGGIAQQADGTSLLGEFRVLGSGFVHSLTSPAEWNSHEWQALPSWVGGIAGISLMDEWAREVSYREVSPEVDAALDFLEPFGSHASFAVMGGFYAAGLALDDRRARGVAIEALAASALAGGIITPTIQRIAGRKRPRHSLETHEFEPFSGNVGFPSGHVTQAFAVASVVATEYDAWWADGLAYGVATGVAMHRMVNGAHHLSDVAAGALIGTVVGRCIARFGQEQRGERVVRPYAGVGLGDGSTPLGISIAF